jgi:hypothetical protein
MQNRILVSGFDHSANSEVAKYLAKESNALVLADHEFNKAIDGENRLDRYRWLVPLINMEEFYHQDIIVLWFGDNDKKKTRVQKPENKRIIDYSNEILFMPYSNKRMNTIRTRIYFVDISQRVRLSDSAEIITNTLGKEDITTFQAETPFIWTFPFDIMELVRN